MGRWRFENIADKYPEFIHQLGWIDKEEKEKYLQECNIFVLPTYFEGLPMSLLEGMSYECACIASAVGGIPQVIEDGVSGVLIQPKDENSLKEAIEKLLQDEKQQEKLGQTGRQRVLDGFELAKSIDKLVEIYTTLR